MALWAVAVLGVLTIAVAVVLLSTMVEAALAAAAIPRRNLRRSALAGALLGLLAAACAVLFHFACQYYAALAVVVGTLGLLGAVAIFRWLFSATWVKATAAVLACALFLTVAAALFVRVLYF